MIFFLPQKLVCFLLKSFHPSTEKIEKLCIIRLDDVLKKFPCLVTISCIHGELQSCDVSVCFHVEDDRMQSLPHDQVSFAQKCALFAMSLGNEAL